VSHDPSEIIVLHNIFVGTMIVYFFFTLFDIYFNFTLALQTNLQFNNNKYYLIQLLQDDSGKAYSVWMRWGRGMCRNTSDGLYQADLCYHDVLLLSMFLLFFSLVGKVGQNSLVNCGGNLAQAKDTFKKK